MQNLPLKKIVAAIVGAVLAVVILAGIVHFAHHDDRKAEVTEGLSQMNKMLPKMIDTVTRLDNVATSDGSDVIYHYTVMGPAVQKITVDDLQPMKAQVVSSYCSSAQLALFRKNDMTLKYMYYREDASFIGELDATTKDCPAVR